jgi:hypothetical protein
MRSGVFMSNHCIALWAFDTFGESELQLKIYIRLKYAQQNYMRKSSDNRNVELSLDQRTNKVAKREREIVLEEQ